MKKTLTMNILHCPSSNEGKLVEEKLQKAGLEFTVVSKESGSTVRLLTETDSYKGVDQIDGYIKSLKSQEEIGKDWENYALTRGHTSEIDLRGN